MTKLAVAYCRTATPQPEQIRNQQTAAGCYATNQLLTLRPACIDLGVSGNTPLNDRTGIAQLLAELANGAEVVLVSSAERISRQFELADEFLKLAETFGAKVIETENDRILVPGEWFEGRLPVAKNLSMLSFAELSRRIEWLQERVARQDVIIQNLQQQLASDAHA